MVHLAAVCVHLATPRTSALRRCSTFKNDALCNGNLSPSIINASNATAPASAMLLYRAFLTLLFSSDEQGRPTHATMFGAHAGVREFVAKAVGVIFCGPDLLEFLAHQPLFLPSADQHNVRTVDQLTADLEALMNVPAGDGVDFVLHSFVAAAYMLLDLAKACSESGVYVSDAETSNLVLVENDGRAGKARPGASRPLICNTPEVLEDNAFDCAVQAKPTKGDESFLSADTLRSDAGYFLCTERGCIARMRTADELDAHVTHSHSHSHIHVHTTATLPGNDLATTLAAAAGPHSDTTAGVQRVAGQDIGSTEGYSNNHVVQEDKELRPGA